jgi:amino acid transporter
VTGPGAGGVAVGALRGPRASSLRRDLGLLPLLAIVFFNVSGGPYGSEDIVASFGPGLTLVLLVLTPLVWSLPVVLVMSELAAAMPEEGGYVAWTSRAFGPFWGFQVGWWSWIDSFIDVAVYPALFVEYVAYWIPGLTPLERWLVALAFIAVLTILNLLGARPVGRTAVVLGIAALLPIGVLVVAGFANAKTVPWVPFAVEGQTLGASLGLGLAVVMWNYSGWDTPATCLGETRAPERAYRHALLLALPLIAAAYVLPTAAIAAAGVPPERWSTGALPALATAVGGAWLGHAVAAGAVVSTGGLFLSLLLTNSRLPYVLAGAGMLPRALAAVDAAGRAPRAAVLVSAACYAVFAMFSFRELIILNVWLYSLALLFELAAFVTLRFTQPDLPRPWRVPGGPVVAVVMAAVPAAVSLLAMATAGWTNTLAGVAAALTGPLAWAALRRRRPA